MATENKNEEDSKFETAKTDAIIGDLNTTQDAALISFKSNLIEMAKQNNTDRIVATAIEDIKLRKGVSYRLATQLIKQFYNQSGM